MNLRPSVIPWPFPPAPQTSHSNAIPLIRFGHCPANSLCVWRKQCFFSFFVGPRARKIQIHSGFVKTVSLDSHTPAVWYEFIDVYWHSHLSHKIITPPLPLTADTIFLLSFDEKSNARWNNALAKILKLEEQKGESGKINKSNTIGTYDCKLSLSKEILFLKSSNFDKSLKGPVVYSASFSFKSSNCRQIHSKFRSVTLVVKGRKIVQTLRPT